MSKGTVADTLELFQKWLYLPDPQPVLAVLGAIAANLLEGDPVWLMLVGPPGCGKTEILHSVAVLPDVHPTATLTEPALLSGTPKKEQENGARGGLLRKIGDFGIILCKDFTSVLSMQREGRAQVLAALREIYDGSWTRHVGTEGGKTLSWSGKVGLVAGCTPTIDRHHAVMGAMGERFALLRLAEVDPRQQARRTLKHVGKEVAMRRELGEAAASTFNGSRRDPQPLTENEVDRLISLTTLVARARSAVERDSYTREIELVPGHEAPTRLVKVLERLLTGLDALGVDRQQAWPVVARVGLDSIPAMRRAVLDALLDAGDKRKTAGIAEAIGYPKRTTERALEDLNAHGVVDVYRLGQGKETTWELAAWATDEYRAATSPEMSGAFSINYSNSTSVNISGEVREEPANPHDQADNGQRNWLATAPLNEIRAAYTDAAVDP